MKCPFCKNKRDKVIDSRSANDGDVIRRRRECTKCKRRYTTYEKVEEMPFRVVKKDGTRVPFDRERIMKGMLKACEKRPVPVETIERITADIESKIHELFDKEVAAKFIGRMVMEALQEVDKVAYVRFASVYREFQDVSDFMEEAEKVMGKEGHGKAAKG